MHWGGVACYGRNDLSYSVLSVSPRQSENIFFEILVPHTKSITGTIYHPQSQSDVLEVLNSISKIDSEWL